MNKIKKLLAEQNKNILAGILRNLTETKREIDKGIKKKEEIEKIPEWERTDKEKESLQKIEEIEREMEEIIDDIFRIIYKKTS